MKFNERMDGDWLVVELVPEVIEANTAIQFGEPTVCGSRITTQAAAWAWIDKNWDDFGGLTKEAAFAAHCFEAGRQYQRDRKLRKKIDEACSAGWEKHNQAVKP